MVNYSYYYISINSLQLYVNVRSHRGPFWLCIVVYDLQQVTKDYGLERVSGPLTYNDITSASPEGRRDIWTDRERDWEEAEALDTGQERPDVLYLMVIGCVRAKGRSMGPGRGRL